MLRRSLFAILLALAAVLGVLPASARGPESEMTELPPGAPGAGGAGPRQLGPARLLPHDVPVMVDAARTSIPPLPSGYVTKSVGGWLDFSYPAGAEERVASILVDADAVKAQLTQVLGQPVLSKVIVRVAQTTSDMARLAPREAPPPAYASGVAYHGMHFVLLSMIAPHGAEAVDLDEVFRHELAHVALEDAVGGKHVPVWFNEGLAISVSGEPYFARTKTLWNATLSGTLIPLADLDRSFPSDNFEVSIAYAESADFMRFLTRKSDAMRFTAMIGRVREGQSFDAAVADAYGSELRRLELEWQRDLERRFSVIPILTGGGIIWVVVIGALVAAYVRRRRRSRAILERWEREEAIEDARIAAKLALERAEARAAGGIVDVRAVTGATSVKIEHAGRWHTLH